MTAEAGLFLLWLFGLFRKREAEPGLLPIRVPSSTAVTQVTFPSTPPSTLPPWPSAQWELDEPPPEEVVAKAKQLLPILWAGGEGTHRPELVGGRWIMFVAQIVRGGSRGVTAWHTRDGARPSVLEPKATPALTYAPARAALPPSAPGLLPAAASAPSVQTTRPSSTASPARAMARVLFDHGYRKSDQPLYMAFQRSVHLHADGYPGMGTMAALDRALSAENLPPLAITHYAWHVRPGTSGYDGVNAPLWSEWNR